MRHKRMDEVTINANLDAFLHGAQEGDDYQGRRLHEMLDSMLMEREGPEGKLWLTDHGKMLLAEMHRKLSKCEGSDDHLGDMVLDVVQLRPHKGHWKDTCDFVHDLRIAIAVANELCNQRDSGLESDVASAAQLVADRGEYDLSAVRISEVYEEVAATVGGFREMSHC